MMRGTGVTAEKEGWNEALLRAVVSGSDPGILPGGVHFLYLL